MTEVPDMAGFSHAERNGESVTRVAIVDPGSNHSPFPGLGKLFPNLHFDTIGATWPDQTPSGYDILIAPVDGASAVEVEAATRRLRATPVDLRVILVLHHADIATTRRLMREGA